MQQQTGLQPQALRDRPAPIPELEVYRTAYRRLSKARQWEDGSPQAIAITEVMAYCDGLGLHGTEFRERFLDHLQEMDEAYLSAIAKRRKAAQDTPAKSDVVPSKGGGDNA